MTLLLTFLVAAIGQAVPLLFGATGEIITEKSGNLNLGIPGIMYMGGISGLMGAFLYENNTDDPSKVVGVLIAILCSLIASGLGGLLYSVLTVSLRSNQNVVGLALTTFGVGFGNFFGGSLSKLAGGVGQISVAHTAEGFGAFLPKALQVMKYIGAAYILWLAIHIAISKPEVSEEQGSASFMKGFLLQFVNIKIYMFGITALTGFITPYSKALWTLIGFELLIATIGTIGWASDTEILLKALPDYQYHSGTDVA